MELALRVVGQRMTGRQEEACNIARRIVAVEEMQPNSNMVTTRLAQSVIESVDAVPGPSRQEELVQFLTLLDAPHIGSRTVSTSTAVSLQNETGHTLLHLCAVLGYDALATDLLERGADPDVRDATGQTALHLAALRGQVACARVLLQGGADTEIVNAHGVAPVDVARQRGNVGVLALLEGADEESGEEEEEEGEEFDLEAPALDDEADIEADESDLEDESARAITESEEEIVPSCSDEASEDDLYAEQPSRPSLDSISDVRPPFLGEAPKVPSTWFHRTFSHLQPQKAWPLTQVNLPGMPALPAWPVTIPWSQTPEKGTFDLTAFRGFLGAKQEQQQADAGVRPIYPPAPQPEGNTQGLNQVQLRARLARRLGYFPTEVTDREVRAYTYHSQKMRKLKRPMEMLSFATPDSYIKTRQGWPTPDCEFLIDYVAESREPITPSGGAQIVPSKTFAEVEGKQYDIIFVPGGPGTRPHVLSPAVREFVKKQAPGATYVLSVCTGSWVLADAGVLDGKRATTNKAAFKDCVESTSKAVKWVAKARWVVDGNVWTSSGVTAGADMGYAFMKHVTGDEFATKVKNIVELHASGPDDDEFAEIFGLV
ncbi:hypothetical protein FRC10_004143 [Ceratobasidium sp. 414]|nr:hypothetical protein FRC10_004143 [Ceratobasidium sp. 414]